MHRLTTAAAPIAAVLVLASMASCGADQGLRDQAEVERLRMRISRVRYAISETRGVIAQSRGAPYVDELYMRLAELQSEEAQYHYMVAQRRENSTGAVHAPQVRFLKEESIAIYERILREDPDTPLGARILFNIAHEHRELGNFEEMISTLQRLIEDDRYSSNRYRTEALLVLGDYYFDRNEMADARRYYQQILQGEANSLHGLAQYKLGWVYVNDGNCKSALNHFEKGLEAARDWSKRRAEADREAALAALEAERAGIEVRAPGGAQDGEDEPAGGHKAVDVRREALVDLIYCYSTVRPAKEIIPYLRERAYNRGAYIAALERAAARYGVMEEAVGGAAVARELLRLASDDEDRLDDARMLHAAVTRNGEYAQVGRDVALILRAMRRRITRAEMPEKARNRLKGEFEVLARDLSTKAQAQADEDESAEKAREAASAYRVYLINLPGSEHRLDMTANLANTLARAGEWLAAGRRYREVAEITEDEEERDNAHYEAVAAYQKVLSSEQPRSHLERVEARAGMRQAGLAFLRTEPQAEKALKIRFAVAQTYYDEGRYRKAIDLLTAVAYEFPNTSESSGAINLVLDSYHTLNDYDGLIAAGRMFLGQKSPATDALRAQIRPIVESAEQRRLDELSLDASGDRAGGTERLEAFAERYEGTDLGERALLSAFVAARAAGNTDRMYELATQIGDQYPNSEQLPGVLSTVGRTAAARFEFSKALDLYERAAEANPDERSRLLLAAGQLREELADYDGAERAYKQVIRSNESAAQREAAIRLSDIYAARDDTRDIISLLTPLADTGDPEILSRLGMAEVQNGDRNNALDHLDLALANGASGQVSARTQYAQAEITMGYLERFSPEPTIDGVQELLDLVEQVESLFLGVVQQGESRYTFAAFARVAYAYALAGRVLAGVRLTDISGEEGQQLQEALDQRAQQLVRQSEEALGACAERVLQLHRFDPAARSCLATEPPDSSPAALDTFGQRSPATISGVEEIRAQLATNPEHLESLVALGRRFLDAGDFHAARMILARAVEAGGGPEVLNLLGLAAAQAGDESGALEAFSRAADGGQPAAQRNFVAMLRNVGLDHRAEEAQQQVSEPAPPDHLLPSAR